MPSSSRRSFLAAGVALPAAVRIADKPASSSPALRYRVLGKTGLKVTELGFGCEAVSDVSVLDRAIDLGINFFDTARSYEGGGNERVLAAAFKGRRKNVFVATRSYGDNAKTIAADLDTSLKELKTDYVDIWYIGAKDQPHLVTDDMLEVQHAAQKAGKIRFRGLSTHRPWNMLDHIAGKGKYDVVQIPYNFAMGSVRDSMKMDATQLDHTLAELNKAGIGVVAMKVMAGGYKNEAQAPPDRLADVHGRAGAHAAALRWALRTPHIHTTSVRMQDRDQFDENMQAMASRYSQEDGRTLARRMEFLGARYCRMCGHCDGVCPQGVPVADCVRFLTYAEGYGQFQMGYTRFQALPAAVRDVRCADCRECAVQCPNGVAVRSQLIRAQEMFG